MRRKAKLTPYERQIEAEIERGEWVPVSKEENEQMAAMLARFRKDAVLNLRVNSNDLALLKEKATKLGVKYQTFIAEHLHRLAHSKMAG